MQNFGSLLEKTVLLSLPEVEIVARTVPSSDNGRPCEPCTPIRVTTGHLLHSLGHQGRYGGRVMQDSGSLLEQTFLSSFPEVEILARTVPASDNDHWPTLRTLYTHSRYHEVSPALLGLLETLQKASDTGIWLASRGNRPVIRLRKAPAIADFDCS